MSLLWALGVYVVGGVTFLPLVLISFWFFSAWYLPPADDNDLPGLEESKKTGLAESAQESERDDRLQQELEDGVDAYQTGWLTVSREYFIYPNGGSKNVLNPPPAASNDASIKESESAYSSLYRLVSNGRSKSSIKSSSSPSPSPSLPSTPNLDADEAATSGGAKPSRPPKQPASSTASGSKLSKYFAVLRHGNLFLYDDANQTNVKHVVVIANHVVTMWPPKVPDGSLFIKRSAICLARIDHGDPDAVAEGIDAGDSPPINAFFLYSDNCSEKEDFYFALIRASKLSTGWKKGYRRDRKGANGDDQDENGISEDREDSDSEPDWNVDPEVMAYPLKYKTNEIISLLQALHSSDTSAQTRWFNAITGRLFLAIKDTSKLEQYFRKKIVDKLSRVKRPAFLDEIEVRKISCGHSVPIITNPKLREFTPEGLLVVGANVAYAGSFTIVIATKAVINLGARFKSRDVSLVLSVTLKSIEGPLVLKVKPPPSNRIWYGFESMPKMNLLIEPIVSSRQITYSLVTKAIENRIREVVKETLVLPNWDDMTFFDTSDEFYRGGIWDKSKRPKPGDKQHKADTTTSDGPGKETAAPDENGSDEGVGESSALDTPALRRRRVDSEAASTAENENEFSQPGSMGSPKLARSSSSVSGQSTDTAFEFDPSEHIGELNRSATAHTSTSPTNKASALMGSVKKWGSWYFKDKLGKQAGPRDHSRSESTSSSDTLEASPKSPDSATPKGSSQIPKPAPQAHQFPPEMLSMINGRDGVVRGNPYAPAPEMKVPVAPTAAATTATTTVSAPAAPMLTEIHNPPSKFPKRKPVGHENEGDGDRAARKENEPEAESGGATVGSENDEDGEQQVQDSQKGRQGVPSEGGQSVDSRQERTRSDYEPQLFKMDEDKLDAEALSPKLPQRPSEEKPVVPSRSSSAAALSAILASSRSPLTSPNFDTVEGEDVPGLKLNGDRSHRPSIGSSASSSVSSSSESRKLSIISMGAGVQEGLVLDDSRAGPTISPTNKSSAVGVNGSRTSRTKSVRRKPVGVEAEAGGGAAAGAAATGTPEEQKVN